MTGRAAAAAAAAAIVAAAAALGPVPAPAQPAGAAPAGGCPPRPAAPRVDVALEDPDPPVSRALGVAELHARSGMPRTAASHHLGFTASRVEWSARLGAAAAAGLPGAVCAVPAEVALTLRHAEHVVRIAREIPAGGCLDREVVAHERRHVAVNRATLRRAAADARRAVEAWARTAEGRGTTAEEASAALREGLRAALEPVVAAMQAARARAHAAIDTPEEYRELGRACAADQVRLRDRLGGG